jgi:hypothetical protein
MDIAVARHVPLQRQYHTLGSTHVVALFTCSGRQTSRESSPGDDPDSKGRDTWGSCRPVRLPAGIRDLSHYSDMCRPG